MNKSLLCLTCLMSALATTAHAQDEFEKTIELGVSYTDTVQVKGNGTSIRLDDVVTKNLGVRAEKELLRHENLAIYGSLAGSGKFGDGTVSSLDTPVSTTVNYRRLEGFADVTARLEKTDWMPYASAGIGMVHDKVEFDANAVSGYTVYEDLTPAARYQVGVEKKMSNKVSIGFSAGQVIDLD